MVAPTGTRWGKLHCSGACMIVDWSDFLSRTVSLALSRIAEWGIPGGDRLAMTQSGLNLSQVTAVLPVRRSSIELCSGLVYSEPIPGRLSSWAGTSMVVEIAGRDMT